MGLRKGDREHRRRKSRGGPANAEPITQETAAMSRLHPDTGIRIRDIIISRFPISRIRGR